MVEACRSHIAAVMRGRTLSAIPVHRGAIQHDPENKGVEVVNKADLRYDDSRQELEQRR